MATGAQYKQWMEVHADEYTDVNGDVNMTGLAEACAEKFGVMSEDGNTEEETIIFEIATDFFQG